MRIAVVLLILAGCRAAPEQVRYARPARGLECSFEIKTDEGGWSIHSVTGTLSVRARYDAEDRLIEAEARLEGGEAARVEVAEGRARVHRTGQAPADFEVPPDVIVTSAPDWTDAFRICRLWDRARGGRQEFPGLWIHPKQAPMRLTFTAEREGVDGPYERLRIRLRGGSAYRAWADARGRMLKLVALPFTERSAVLVREGFEREAEALR